MIKIAIIDDGINFNKLDNSIVGSEYALYKNKDVKYSSHFDKTDSHGLIVASIIKQSIKIDCEIISIKVKDEIENGCCYNFLKALDLCEELEVDIANISIGSCYRSDFTKIEKKVKKILRNNAIIVAATNNKPLITYPAYIQGVIGVRSNIRAIEGRSIFLKNSHFGVNVESSPPRHLIDKNNEMIALPICNSFATPVVTALVASLINKEERLEYADLIDRIKKHADYIKESDFSPIHKNSKKE